MPLAKVMIVTPLDQGPDAKTMIIKVVPVQVGHIVTITKGVKYSGDMSTIDMLN